MYAVTGHRPLTTRSIADQPLTSTADDSVDNTSALSQDTPSHTDIRLDILPRGSIIGGPKEGITVPISCTIEDDQIIFSGAMAFGSELENTTVGADYEKGMRSIMNSESNWPKMQNGLIQAAWELENPKPAKRVHTHQLLASQKVATLLRRLCEAASLDIKPPGIILSNPVYPEYMCRVKHGGEYHPPSNINDLTMKERDTLQQRSTKLYEVLHTAQAASFMSFVDDPHLTGRELRRSVGWRNPGTLESASSVVSIASATPNAAAHQAKRRRAKEEARREATRKAGQAATLASRQGQSAQGTNHLSGLASTQHYEGAVPLFGHPPGLVRCPASSEAQASSHGFYTGSLSWPESPEPPSQSRSRKRPASSNQPPQSTSINKSSAIQEQGRHYHPQALTGQPDILPTNPTFRGYDGKRPHLPVSSAAHSLVATDGSLQRSALPLSYAQPVERCLPSARATNYVQSVGSKASQALIPIGDFTQLAQPQSSEANRATLSESGFQVNFGEDEYYQVAHTPSLIPQTAAGGYNHPGQYSFPHLIPATTGPVSSNNNNKPAETRYSRSFNSGTGVRIVNPDNVNANQLVRRIDPTPNLSQANMSGFKVPWTIPSTYGASMDQQQPVPSAHPNVRRPAPSIHDFLLGSLVRTDADGELSLTPDQRFGRPRRIRGPRKEKGGEQDR
jgi:hypothetical protein